MLTHHHFLQPPLQYSPQYHHHHQQQQHHQQFYNLNYTSFPPPSISSLPTASINAVSNTTMTANSLKSPQKQKQRQVKKKEHSSKLIDSQSLSDYSSSDDSCSNSSDNSSYSTNSSVQSQSSPRNQKQSLNGSSVEHGSTTKITGQQIIVGNDGPYGVFMNRSGVIKLDSDQFDDIVVHHTNTIDNSATFTSSGKDRYKTEMCRSWDEYGYCRYGDKCQFAHGEHELREVSRHHKYKSELCNNYHYEGTCMYGIRCCFIHKVSPEDMGRALSQNIDVVSLKCLSHRLSVFKDVCALCSRTDHPNTRVTEQPHVFDPYAVVNQDNNNNFVYHDSNNSNQSYFPMNVGNQPLIDNGNYRVAPASVAAPEYMEHGNHPLKLFPPQYYLYPSMPSNNQVPPQYQVLQTHYEPILN